MRAPPRKQKLQVFTPKDVHVEISLTKSEAKHARRAFADEENGAHVCEGCACIGCVVLRKVRDRIRELGSL